MNATSFCLFIAGLQCFQPEPPDVVGPLVAALREPDVEVRSYSAYALAAIGAPAVEPIIKMLDDPDHVARAGAAYALGQFGQVAAPAKEKLLRALKDQDRDVRRQAAYALSKLLTAERELLTP